MTACITNLFACRPHPNPLPKGEGTFNFEFPKTLLAGAATRPAPLNAETDLWIAAPATRIE